MSHATSCNATCGGFRTRNVTCYAVNSTAAYYAARSSAGGSGRSLEWSGSDGSAAASTGVVAPLDNCTAAGLVIPSALVPCEPCGLSFCNMTTCSGNGVCSEETNQCSCKDGYSGKVLCHC